MDLLDDIIIYVCKFLSDADKIKFLSTSTHMHSLKNRTEYHSCDVKKIYQLWYFNQFTQVTINDCATGNINDYIPKNAKRLIIKTNYDGMINFPQSVTHLTCNGYFNQPIKIPATITHLKLSGYFNQPLICPVTLEPIIPSSVIYLMLGPNMVHPLINNGTPLIPSNIKYLYFNGSYRYSQLIGAIPPSVTHLSFDDNINDQLIGVIPPNVTHITFGFGFNMNINNAIPPTIQYLNFSGNFNQKIELAHLTNLREIHLHYQYPNIVHVCNTCKIVGHNGRVRLSGYPIFMKVSTNRLNENIYPDGIIENFF